MTPQWYDDVYDEEAERRKYERARQLLLDGPEKAAADYARNLRNGRIYERVMRPIVWALGVAWWLSIPYLIIDAILR